MLGPNTVQILSLLICFFVMKLKDLVLVIAYEIAYNW